ncbi:MAG TPA: methylated-DNA--[protein]-cysteine S-methyltransferase [Candidatus Acidoferrales bacterium]|nr:methylated-DNA--[protein]-cysteine S-methyltransferase [Candidatus Acidoferrales bacterium]
MFYTKLQSPVGPLLLAATERGICRLSFMAGRHSVAPVPGWKRARAPFARAIRQLESYFAGRLREFDLPLDLEGTPFQLRVWQRLPGIPYGETISYGELAREIGRPGAARAVGLANGSNPVAIILPCHRVVGSNGALTGYGGGLLIKHKLLALEGRQLRLF